MDSFRKLQLEKENLQLLLAQAEQILAETEPTAPTVIQKKGEEDMEERAKALFQRFQIMAALDYIENQGKTTHGEGRACYTMEQFIDVTRPGRLDAWNDDLILKFVEGMELTDDGEVAVRFKAGVTATVEIPERRFQAKNPLMVE